MNNYEDFYGESKKKKYVSYKTRVLISSSLFCIFIISSIFLILTSLSAVKLENINYKETSNLDYKVYLKENDFYPDKYLEKDKTYVASLIKNITVNFNYEFTIDKPSNMNIEYNVIGKLVITNPKEKSKSLLEREYILLNDVTDKIVESNNYSIDKEIEIDYDYYNNLANKFRYNYGVDTESYLKVYLTVKGENTEENSFDIKNNSTMALTIPLSEKMINIKLDYKDLNQQKKIVNTKNAKINDRLKFIIGISLLIIALISLVYLLRLLSYLIRRKTKYDKYINKILREYDRLIINTTSAPILDGYNVIKIDSFQELLDARDNVKGAIKYYVITEHQKCNFYFTHNKDLYLLVIKAVDID